MQKIKITIDSNKVVDFETVSVDNTENVFFVNLDPTQPHWPTIASNQVGPAPSAPSSQCQPNPNVNPNPDDYPIQVTYRCQIAGHENESGIINIVAQLAAVANTTLSDAVSGKPIASQQVVLGGVSPYQISGELFEVTGLNSQSGSGIGPGLHLIPTIDNNGVFVSGTPTMAGNYTFTFEVNDGTGANLQQVQYQMVVS